MKKILLFLLVFIGIGLLLIYLSVGETKDTFRTCTITSTEVIGEVDFRKFDSIKVAANTLYSASKLKEIMQGQQYRKAWSAPVVVPIAYLDTLRGGLKIIKEGGGKQTHSLKLSDNNGIIYTLRSLSKDPHQLVPEFAKALGLENIIVDGVSAQHPYSALVVAQLSDDADILHTHPTLYFIPKQESLGKFNDKYGDRLYYFEYESEGKVNWTSIKDVSEIVDTDDLLKLKNKHPELITVDKPSLIRARLFDILIGDWDRHAKQWGWVLRDTSDRQIAIPLPTDRDNAFFNLEGVIPKLIANKHTLPEVQPFTKDIHFLPGLVSDFDEYFLRGSSSEVFLEQAKILQKSLTDKKIDDAFHSWPLNIRKLDADKIISTLKYRRDQLDSIAVEYHNIIIERPIKEILLKGCEDLELQNGLKKCFDCLADQETSLLN